MEPVTEDSQLLADAPDWDDQGVDLEFEATPAFTDSPETNEHEADVPVLDLSGIDLDLDTAPADFDLEPTLEVPAPVAEEPAAPAPVEDLVAQPDAPVVSDLADEFTPADDAEPADFLADAPFDIEPMDSVAEETEVTAVEPESEVAPPADAIDPELWEEVNTKLDLARAYLEMGDQEGAREILQEVLGEGDAQQKADADKLLAEAG